MIEKETRMKCINWKVAVKALYRGRYTENLQGIIFQEIFGLGYDSLVGINKAYAVYGERVGYC